MIDDEVERQTSSLKLEGFLFSFWLFLVSFLFFFVCMFVIVFEREFYVAQAGSDSLEPLMLLVRADLEQTLPHPDQDLVFSPLCPLPNSVTRHHPHPSSQGKAVSKDKMSG